MQQTICAKVSERLLTKASRLFTGTLDGRIIEILQNARRAGATEVRISNKNGLVTVQDNGSGIEDFQKLLDLGDSGWDEQLEAGEDPAGVGLFSLAPREVEIVSGSRKIVIDKDGWTGKPVEVTEAAETVSGTILKFKEEKPWDMETVEKHAVFAGIRVIVDGKFCHQMPFCGSEAVEYADLGCKVEVVSEMSKYHHQWADSSYLSKVLVNFHGQVVELDSWPGTDRFGVHKISGGLHILVDLTQQTQIRLMLPARTKLVENEVLQKLKEAIEIEYYRYFQKQKEHSLYYKEYLRARELGIDLPEATPTYSVGLLRDEYDQVVEVFEPKDFKLSDGYLCYDEDLLDETGEVNVHLLAALGTFQEKTFVPVEIQQGYREYSWAQLPKVTAVNVIKGKERIRRSVGSYELVCVESLLIEVETSNEKKFHSEVPMAAAVEPPIGKYKWHNEVVYVTQAARKELSDDNIWYHLGGFDVEGDCYETQQYYFEQEINEFWSLLIGPYEQLRHELVSQISREYRLHEKWRKVTIQEDHSIEIVFRNGNKQRVSPPAESI